MAKIISGGGITGNKLVRVGVKGGSRSTQPVSPAGMSQYGTAQGGRIKGTGSFTGINSAKNVFEAKKADATPMGNAIAASTVCGPGGSRTVYRSGTNAVHGPVAGPAPIQGRSIFDQFPPEVTDKSPLVHKR